MPLSVFLFLFIFLRQIETGVFLIYVYYFKKGKIVYFFISVDCFELESLIFGLCRRYKFAQISSNSNRTEQVHCFLICFILFLLNQNKNLNDYFIF